MTKEKIPITPATRMLREHKIEFTDHLYVYEEHGGTAVSACELGVEEHTVIKTLVMENDQKQPLLVLMHGDMEVSTKNLARFLGVKSISPCTPENANKHTGYLVGGTSPFSTKKTLPVYMEKSILSLPKIYINGGKRGYLVGLSPQELTKILNPTLVEVGIPS